MRLWWLRLITGQDHHLRLPQGPLLPGGACMKNAAMAGFLTLDKFHGAAVEDCMKVLKKALELTQASSGDETEKFAIVKAFLKSEKEAGRKIPGFGHRQHPHDPRVDKLFALTMDAGVDGQYIAVAQAISKALSESIGKELPINVDGAVAAILCELGLPRGTGECPIPHRASLQFAHSCL